MDFIRHVLVLTAAFTLAFPTMSRAISVAAFDAWGGGGSENGQVFEIGEGGEVFQIDAFVHFPGEDLNGGYPGTAAQLSVDVLEGLEFVFSAMLTDSNTDIILSYTITNYTGSDIANFGFISFFDAHIDVSLNGFANEIAETSGTLVDGQGWEADEPDFVFGDIFSNAGNGSLDDSNAVASEEDVAMALSFHQTFGAGQTFIWKIMISEDGDKIAQDAFAISQTDASSSTEITYSGSVTVPEPNTGFLFGLGLIGLGGV